MLQLPFPCPSCSSSQWRELGAYTYLRSEHDSDVSTLSEYQRLRRRVLFEVWAPDAAVLELRAQVCLTCALIIYSPRPTAADVDAKYRFLQVHERSIGGTAETARG